MKLGSRRRSVMAPECLPARRRPIPSSSERCTSVIGRLRRALAPVTMDGVDLDPAHIRSFLAIVRYGGYPRAADALHLTQPAVSRHMRRLEEQLGEALFARSGRGVQLTAHGERAAAEPAQGVSAPHPANGPLPPPPRGAGAVRPGGIQ